MNLSAINTVNRNTPHFKGWCACPLDAIVIPRHDSITSEVKKICKEEGVKVIDRDNGPDDYPWTQDDITVAPNRKLFYNQCRKESNPDFIPSLAAQYGLQTVLTGPKICGGNMFFIKKGGENILLIGEDDFQENSGLEKRYGVDKVIPLPQMDAHLDLFMRPLKDTILIADDTLMIANMIAAAKTIKKEFESGKLSSAQKNAYKEIAIGLVSYLQYFHEPGNKEKFDEDRLKLKQISEILSKNGFNVKRVPGRIYSVNPDPEYYQTPRYVLNYLNAMAFEKKNGKIAYVTNESNLDKKFGITPEIAADIGFSFEKAFVDSLAGLVDKEDIHFVSGVSQMLFDHCGGIHCLYAEIPSER